MYKGEQDFFYVENGKGNDLWELSDYDNNNPNDLIAGEERFVLQADNFLNHTYPTSVTAK